MKRTTRTAGAFATATMLFAMLMGTDVTGAYAQSETVFPLETDMYAGEIPAAVDSDADVAQSAVRFVASSVVQDIPEPPEPASDPDNLRQLVAATPEADELGRDLMCLAEAIYFEARGEPLAGQLAVARVIVNRSASPMFPDDYCAVVTQRAQFSFVRRGRIPSPNIRSAAWARATRIARIAHQDLWASPVEDALYFHAGHVRPRWANRKVARATIDNHVFYR